MAAEAPRTFEYHQQNWWPTIKPLPDLIPFGVGFLTFYNRGRKERGLPILEDLQSLVIGLRDPRLLRSAGTYNWPEPTGPEAHERMLQMARRNAAFPLYHGFSLFFLVELISNVSPLVNVVNAAIEHLPKLPTI